MLDFCAKYFLFGPFLSCKSSLGFALAVTASLWCLAVFGISPFPFSPLFGGAIGPFRFRAFGFRTRPLMLQKVWFPSPLLDVSFRFDPKQEQVCNVWKKYRF